MNDMQLNRLQFSTLQVNLTCNGLVINVNNVGGGGNWGPGFENLGGGGGLGVGLGGGVGGGGLGGNVGNVGGFGGGVGGGFGGGVGLGAISALNLILQAQNLILNINDHGAPFQWPAQDGGAPVDLGPAPAPVEAPAPLNWPAAGGPMDLDAMDPDEIEEAFNQVFGELNHQLAPNGEQPNQEDNQLAPNGEQPNQGDNQLAPNGEQPNQDDNSDLID